MKQVFGNKGINIVRNRRVIEGESFHQQAKESSINQTNTEANVFFHLLIMGICEMEKDAFFKNSTKTNQKLETTHFPKSQLQQV